jgi:hydroxymethylglutaryl-CoA reductase
MPTRGSRIPGFYNLSLEGRLAELAQHGELSAEDIAALSVQSGLAIEQADHMIENVVGLHALPLGIALNFIVNGREVLIPMAIEEPSVVAGASFMAKLARLGGGFIAKADPPEMIGQIQLLGVTNLLSAQQVILKQKISLLAQISELDPVLKQLGGGPRDLEVRLIEGSPIGSFLVVHLIYDVRDAMGANAVNVWHPNWKPLLVGRHTYASCPTWRTDAWHAPNAQFHWTSWHLETIGLRMCGMASSLPGRSQ